MPVVKWGHVAAGAVLTGLSAIVVTPLSMIAGATFAEQLQPRYAIGGGMLLSLAIAFVVIGIAWLALRKRNPDAAMGVLLGGAFVVLLSGGCGALLSAFARGGAMH